MALGWLVILQSVPWAEVIKNAPKVAGAAKKLWNAVTKKSSPGAGSHSSAEAGDHSSLRNMPGIDARVNALEAEMADLKNQMVASTELIKELAEQNTQLVRRVEIHRVRLKWIIVAGFLFALISLFSLVLVLSRT
jgi:hypothetical protein